MGAELAGARAVICAPGRGAQGPPAAAAGTRGRGEARSPAQPRGAHPAGPVPPPPSSRWIPRGVRGPQPAGDAPPAAGSPARDSLSAGLPRRPDSALGALQPRELAVRVAEPRGWAEERWGFSCCRQTLVLAGALIPQAAKRASRPPPALPAWGHSRAAAGVVGGGPALLDDHKC